MIQLGLTRQDDLEQFPTGIFQVAEQAHFFQNVRFEIVGFVDDQGCRGTALGLPQQECIEREQNSGFRGAFASQFKIVGQHFEELIGRETRVEDRGEGDVLLDEEFAQAFEQGGFAGSGVAGQDDESLAVLHAVNQIRQGFFVLPAAIEEAPGQGLG